MSNSHSFFQQNYSAFILMTNFSIEIFYAQFLCLICERWTLIFGIFWNQFEDLLVPSERIGSDSHFRNNYSWMKCNHLVQANTIFLPGRMSSLWTALKLIQDWHLVSAFWSWCSISSSQEFLALNSSSSKPWLSNFVNSYPRLAWGDVSHSMTET